MKNLTVKKGDNVVVIAGKEKGKSGKVLASAPEQNKVLVEGINIITRHKKPKNAQDKSAGLIKKEAMFDASNVQIICPVCSKATRVSHKEVEGKKARVCKKCGASLDKAYTKAVKNSKKAEAKVEKVSEPKTEAKKVAKKVEPKTEKVIGKTTQQKSKTTTVKKTNRGV